MTHSRIIYLAAPFTHPDPLVREDRYIKSCKAAAELIRLGHIVFAPLAHTYGISIHGNLAPCDGRLWQKQDMPILTHCGRLVILTLDGWQESNGVALEHCVALALDIPVTYIASHLEADKVPLS